MTGTVDELPSATLDRTDCRTDRVVKVRGVLMGGPQAPWNPTDRCLHLVDIENLLGNPRPADTQQAVEVFEAYLAAAVWRPGDLVVVASNPGLMKTLAFQLPDIPCSRRCVRGQDGADRLLLQAVPNHLPTRFSRLVIGSGDGIFTDLADNTSRTSVETWVVSGVGFVARGLRRTADQVRAMTIGEGPVRFVVLTADTTAIPIAATNKGQTAQPDVDSEVRQHSGRIA